MATYTPYPTYTPLPTVVPTFTITPAITTTPVADAIVLGTTVNLMDGPGQTFGVIEPVHQENQLKVIGQYGNCGWLKVTAPSQATGWLLNDGYNAILQKPCESIPNGTYRPQTRVIKTFGSTGEGQLATENGLANDAVIILTSSSAPADSLASVYIRSNETFVLEGIPDGNYIVFFAIGSEWDGAEFTEDKRIWRFDDKLDFTTSQFQYTTWRITLHTVPGGTAEQSEVSPDEFPGIE